MVKRSRSLSPINAQLQARDRWKRSTGPLPPGRDKLPVSSSDDILAEAVKGFQIFSWNVNGVSQFLKSNTPQITSYFSSPSSPSVATPNTSPVCNSLRKFLERHSWPEILCLQEVKINPQDASTKGALERAANRSVEKDGGPAYTAHFSLPTDRYNATGFGRKVHGVCTLIQTSLISCSTTYEVDWDLEGRVLITEFSKWTLAVINGYWVNGTTNPYRSPRTGAVIGTRHDRKREFHSLMLAEVKRFEARGWHVVLIGDMNVAPSVIDGHPNLREGFEHVRNRKDLNEKFLFTGRDGMRGIDTFRHFHGGLRKYTYHGEPAERWGETCDRVDLGVVSRTLVENVRGALVGAEIWDSVEERGHSDHVPISIILDAGRLGAAEKIDASLSLSGSSCS